MSNNLKKFPCNWDGCERVFRSAIDLDRHIRTHTGEKPFACHLCPYRASLMANLKRHIKNHTRRGENPHEAEVDLLFNFAVLAQQREDQVNDMLLNRKWRLDSLSRK